MNAKLVDRSFYISMRNVWELIYTILLLLAILLIFSGCTLLQTQVGPTAKKLTDYYCAQPLEARLMARAEVAKAIAPATLVLTCAGDKPATPSP
jgi:uncharacterized protein YceK